MCFNALYRAYSISTQKKHLTSQQMEGCFNALYRAYSISTSAKIYGEIKIGDVSMPFIGLIPFLRSLAEKTGVSTSGVSMPFIGLIPFLLSEYEVQEVAARKFQCPLSGLFHFYHQLQRR